MYTICGIEVKVYGIHCCLGRPWPKQWLVFHTRPLDDAEILSDSTIYSQISIMIKETVTKNIVSPQYEEHNKGKSGILKMPKLTAKTEATISYFRFLQIELKETFSLEV